MLEKVFKYYLDNQEGFVQRYKDRFIVVKVNEILGDYPTEILALTETRKDHRIGTFLIQKCTPGTTDYTETYHSRVTFND